MDNTRHNEVGPAAQHGKRGFLDLPPELRNTIYKMISQSTLAFRGTYMWHKTQSPMVASGPTRKVAISAIAGTNRQIRAEFLSQELPNYLIVIHSEDPADYWSNHLDETFKRGLSHLLLLGLDIQLDSYPEPYTYKHSTHFPFADYLNREIDTEGGPNQVKLRAAHTDDASKPARTQFLFTFHYNSSRYILFASEVAIRQVLIDVYFGDQVTSSADLVRTVDLLRGLNLNTRRHGHSYGESIHQSVEYRYIIFDSPRRLKMTARQIRASYVVGVHESFFDFEETQNHGSLIRAYEIYRIGG